MFWFILLVILLVLAVVFFIAFPFFTLRMSNEKYNELCSKKIRRIARRNNLLSVEDLNLTNFEEEKLIVDEIIFGKKYVYLISNLKVKGFVIGNSNDKSWIHYNYAKRKARYISNLNSLLEKNIIEFESMTGIDKDLLVSVCLIPNNCDFSIKGDSKLSSHVIHYSSLNRKLMKLEHKKIDSLDEEAIQKIYERVKEANQSSN